MKILMAAFGILQSIQLALLWGHAVPLEFSIFFLASNTVIIGVLAYELGSTTAPDSEPMDT